MGRAILTGNLTAGPTAVTEGVFPSMRADVQLAFIDGSQGKSAERMTGVLSRQINSPSAYVPLQGVGPTDTVTQGNTLYLKSNAPVNIRITQDDGSGGTDVTEMLGVHGLVVREFSTIYPLELVEIQGSATIEYFFSGPS